MTNLLLAPAGAGKTAHILQRIRQAKAAHPLATITVILPNQTQAAAFRRRLAASGGALGVELHTFHTLYADLLARADQPLPALLDPLQIRLLRVIVDDLCACSAMRHYAALQNRPGFIAALRNTIQELKRARIFPEDFAAAVRGFGPRLEELALVYNEYQQWLRRQNWADSEGRGWLAEIALEEHPRLGSELELLAVCGFDEFNPTQLKVLAQLAARAAETLIAVTGDAVTGDAVTGDATRSPRPAHHRFERARDALIAALQPQIETLSAQSFLAPGLAYLEANLFEPGNRDQRTENGKKTQSIPLSTLYSPISTPYPPIAFLEAQSRPAEARAALRWVKAQMLREGLAPGETAILARDLQPYRPYLEETAAEFGIPLHIVGGLPLAENPAVAALLALLALPVEDWPPRLLLAAWRSPYFAWAEFAITPTLASALDSAARLGRVSGGLAQWRQALAMLETQKPPDERAADEESPLRAADAEQAAALRAAFESFIARLTPPPKTTAREMIAFIEDLIGDDPALTHSDASGRGAGGVGVVACARANPATAGRDVAALRAFKDVLRGLALAETALGTPPLDYPAFFRDLRGALEAAIYYPHDEGGVMAASVLDARGLSFRALALLGLSEGEFPRMEREDIFLREGDRAALRAKGLPLESKLRGDEGTFFYQAITRARERLLLCRPSLAEDGQPWEPSPYWDEARRLAGQPDPRRIRPEDPLPAAEAASLPEFVQSNLSALLAGSSFPLSGSPDAVSPEGLARSAAALRARLARSASGAFEGETPELEETLTARFGPQHGWSASRLEAYGTCPYYFFTAYALELQPRTLPEEGYDVRALGSMLHKILEEVYSQAQDPASLDECLALLPAIAQQVFASAPADYGFRPTPLWAQQQQELERVLARTLTGLAEISQGWTPRHFEARFGMGTPSLTLETPGGVIRLHGYIDRMDLAADGSLRVVDYKAGSAPIGLRDLEEGRRLQLPLYALAARDALRLGEVSGGFYWHIQKAETSSLKLENCAGGVEGAFEQAAAHVARFVDGIRSGRFQPRPPSDGCPSYCPAAVFCWRYKAKGF